MLKLVNVVNVWEPSIMLARCIVGLTVAPKKSLKVVERSIALKYFVRVRNTKVVLNIILVFH